MATSTVLRSFLASCPCSAGALSTDGSTLSWRGICLAERGRASELLLHFYPGHPTTATVVQHQLLIAMGRREGLSRRRGRKAPFSFRGAPTGLLEAFPGHTVSVPRDPSRPISLAQAIRKETRKTSRDAIRQQKEQAQVRKLVSALSKQPNIVKELLR